VLRKAARLATTMRSVTEARTWVKSARSIVDYDLSNDFARISLIASNPQPARRQKIIRE